MKELFLVDMKPFGGAGLSPKELKPEVAAKMIAAGIKVYPAKRNSKGYVVRA